MPRFLRTLFVTSLTTFLGISGNAQDTSSPAPEDSFASENAVLDTSILFSIGAREARQELRGAFGWPTFQEGLVEGVYFRFDPDGYARFAPSPRLDTDVFEVICRPRTLVCMGRKDSLQITLNNRGQVQLELANISEQDQFILSDGISELPLPPAILQPLEPRLELLLAAGGELVVRRNNNEVKRLSLAGFGAVVPYLRWVAARQDYTVLPRGWPVPNAAAGHDTPGLTQTSLWNSPMPQPHVVTQPAADMAPATGMPQVGADVAEVRGELNVLRAMLLDRQSPQGATSAPAQDAPNVDARLAELMQMVATLQSELTRLQESGNQAAAPSAPPPHMAAAQPVLGAVPAPQTSDPRAVARHLEYLMTEIGLAPDVALMVVQQAQQSQQAAADVVATQHDQVVNDILQELRAQLPDGGAVTYPDTQTGAFGTPRYSAVPNGEYQLLTDYFRSVAQGQ